MSKGIEKYFEVSVGKGARGICVSPDGGSVVVNCKDKKIREFNFNDIEAKKKPKAKFYKGPIAGHLHQGLTFSDDGLYFASSDETGNIIIWNANTKEFDKEITLENWALKIFFSPSNKYLGCLKHSKFVVLDLETEEKIYSTGIDSIYFNFISDEKVISFDREGIKILNIVSGVVEQTIEKIKPDSMALSHNKKLIAYVYEDATGKSCAGVYDLEQDEILWNDNSYDDDLLLASYKKVIFSPDDSFFVFTNSYGNVLMFDSKSSKLIAKNDNDDNPNTQDSAISSDGKFIMRVGEDETLSILSIV